MAQRKMKPIQKPDRRANRTILVRTLFLMGIFGVVAFVPLFVKLYQIQITEHDKYEQMAIDQQTRDSTVSANRGTIYDSKGNVCYSFAIVSMFHRIGSPEFVRATELALADARDISRALGYDGAAFDHIRSSVPHMHG